MKLSITEMEIAFYIVYKLASARLRSGDGFSVVSLYDNICILLIL